MDLNKVLNSFLEENNLILEGITITVAVSGGVDSSALLKILEENEEKYGYKIVVCHVNHKKRKESDIEEEYLRDYCKDKHKLYVYTMEYDDKNDESFQEYARNKRYEFFFECMRKENSKYLFLAHHLNDDIETFFLHLNRSSNLSSIAGMRSIYEKNGIYILRPLLNVKKDDLYKYAKENNVKFFEDYTNKEDNYTRNRIRHHIVTSLFEENNSFDSSFLSFKEKIEYASILLNNLRDEFIRNNVIIDSDTIKLNVIEFKKIDNVLKKEVLFDLLKKYNYSIGNINEIIKLINIDKNKFLYNYKDICIIKDNDFIYIKNEVYKNEDFYLKIENTGLYHLNDEYDIIFENNDNIYRNCDITLSNVDILWYNNNGFPFTIRTRIDGDKILLSKGHKKIKDLMIDLKLSKKEKDKALVLLDKDDNILSLLGYKKSSILSKGKDNNLLIRLVRR